MAQGGANGSRALVPLDFEISYSAINVSVETFSFSYKLVNEIFQVGPSGKNHFDHLLKKSIISPPLEKNYQTPIVIASIKIYHVSSVSKKR